MKWFLFTESRGTTLIEAGAKPDGKDWKVVLIQAGWSLNGRYYPAEVLKKAVPLFEKLDACAYRFGDSFDHVPEEAIERMPGGFAKNLVGWFENVTFGKFKTKGGKTGEGIIANFHVLEGQEWLRKNLRDAWDHGRADLLGFSIDAKGLASNGEAEGRSGIIVQEIKEIKETTIVSEPAAGGEVLRLVASVGNDRNAVKTKGVDMNFEKWLESKGLKVADLTETRKTELLKEYEAELKAKESEEDEKAKAAEAEAAKKAEEEAAAEAEAKKAEEDKKAEEAAAKEKELQTTEGRVTRLENRLRVKEAILDLNLPEPSRERVIDRLQDKVGLTDAQIKEEIDREKAYAASLVESAKKNAGDVVDLGDSQDNLDAAEVKVLQEQEEKYDLAWDGYFAGGMNKVGGQEPFHSLKEAYAAINGRYLEPYTMAREIFRSIAAAMPGGPDTPIAEHAQMLKESWSEIHRNMGFREAITTSVFSVAFGQAMFRRLQKKYTEDPRQDYKLIISGRETLQDITNTFTVVRIGGISDLPVVAEGGTYQLITPEQTEVTEVMTPAKRGGLKELTLEAVLADRLNTIRRIPDDLASAAIRTLSKAVWNLLESNPTIQGNALLSTANANLVTSSPALAYDKVADAVQLLNDQTFQDSSEKIGLDGHLLITGPKLRNEAWEITNSARKASSSEDATLDNFLKSIGLSSLATLGLGRTTTTDDHWWVIANPADVETIVVGFLGGRENPDIFVQSPSDTPLVGSAFTADKMTFKIRHVWGTVLADWRGITGSLQ